MTEKKMRIEARPALEAYISKKGYICLMQERRPNDEDAIITIPPEDVEQVIDWLRTLLEERMKAPDSDFEDDESEQASGG